jgi:hypothetical protein
MSVSLHRVEVALNRPTKFPELIVFAMRIVECMTQNPWFPAPVPPLATVQALIDKLRQAEAAAQSRTVGLKTSRTDVAAELVGLLHELKAHVQSVADRNPQSAESIIESAGMSVKGRATRPKPPLAAYPWRVSGAVHLVAKAVAKRAGYDWEMSRDGGQTRIRLPHTVRADTVVTGMEPGETCLFWMRPVTPKGEGDWSEPVAFVVR